VYETGTGGSIISPNYPIGYNNGDSCGWFLTAENGNKIAVVIHDLDTESGQFKLYEFFRKKTTTKTSRLQRIRFIIECNAKVTMF
jgi:hypothetical protein